MAKSPNWSKEDIEKFKELYPRTSQEDLEKIFKRSIPAMETFANRLGIKKEINNVGKRIFLQDEIDYIIKLSQTMSIPDIGRKIGRSKDSIYDLFKKSGIDIPTSNFWWTTDEVNFLKENYEILSFDLLVKKLNKSWGAIKRRAQKMKLLRLRKDGESYKPQKKINKKEQDFILDNYKKLSVTQMAKELNRSDTLILNFCIKNKLSILKLRYDPDDFSDEILLNILLEKAKILQRCPTSDDIQKDKNLPSVDIYYDRFETFSNACELAGLIPNNGRYGILCYSKNGDRCLSTKEQIITNFFIDNNIRYNKEKFYNSIVKSIKQKIRMDWYLLEYDIIVEYFGLNSAKYNERTNKKLEICKNNNLKIISLFEKDINKLEKIFNDFIK